VDAKVSRHPYGLLRRTVVDLYGPGNPSVSGSFELSRAPTALALLARWLVSGHRVLGS
jgi:hypothetical protein